MIFSLFGKKDTGPDLPAELGPLGIPIGGALEPVRHRFYIGGGDASNRASRTDASFENPR